MKRNEPRYYVEPAGSYYGVYDRQAPCHRNRNGHACGGLYTTREKAQEVADLWNKGEKRT